MLDGPASLPLRRHAAKAVWWVLMTWHTSSPTRLIRDMCPVRYSTRSVASRCANAWGGRGGVGEGNGAVCGHVHRLVGR